MIDMRETAESELGSSFDAKEYHTFIMNLGITSIDVYEKALDMWLESKSKFLVIILNIFTGMIYLTHWYDKSKLVWIF